MALEIVAPDVVHVNKSSGNGRVRFHVDEPVKEITILSMAVEGDIDIHIGRNARLRNLRLVLQGAGVTVRIGKNFSCGRLQLNAVRADIEIGDDVLFSHGITVRTYDMHPIFDASGEQINPPRSVLVGDNVWIAQDVKLLAGTHVGRGSVVGTDSVVSRDIPEKCLAVGIPAKVVREDITWQRKDD